MSESTLFYVLSAVIIFLREGEIHAWHWYVFHWMRGCSRTWMLFSLNHFLCGCMFGVIVLLETPP